MSGSARGLALAVSAITSTSNVRMGQAPLRKVSLVSSATRTKLRRRKMPTVSGRQDWFGPLPIGCRGSMVLALVCELLRRSCRKRVMLVRDDPTSALLAQPNGQSQTAVRVPLEFFHSSAAEQRMGKGDITPGGNVERHNLECGPFVSATRKTAARCRGRPVCLAPRWVEARRTSQCLRYDRPGPQPCRRRARPPPSARSTCGFAFRRRS